MSPVNNSKIVLLLDNFVAALSQMLIYCIVNSAFQKHRASFSNKIANFESIGL
jgi:hypothetical protein